MNTYRRLLTTLVFLITIIMIMIPSFAVGSTIWSGSAVPAVVDAGPDNSVELGVKFKSDSAGFISGIRFYKASANSGTHVANLWTDSGTLLATATFMNETVSGWQQVALPNPVPINANTVYVVSYHTNTGHYSDDESYLAGKGEDNPPLHALADGAFGPNGLYVYGPTSSFPNQGWNASNYWIDVVFSPTAPPTPTLSTISLAPASQSIPVGFTQQFAATGIYSDGSTQDLSTQATWSSSNISAITITSAGLATAVSPGSSTISATVSGVTGTTKLAAQSSTTFTIWPSSAVPAAVDSGPDNAVELGLRFKSDNAGYISGIRFYKAGANSGPHVANLWTDSGALLATATFMNETVSGWQQVALPNPVPIAANTVYVVSYHTNTGHYSDDETYLAGKGVDNPPLHALADAISGANGLYAYGAASGFPSQGWNASNYWVDVVFTANGSGGGDTTAPTVTGFTIPTTAGALSVPITTFTATDNVLVTGYLVTEEATAPSSSDPNWSSAAPGFYTFSSTGAKTLYAWAKDAAGNVSASRSATVTITLSASGPEPAGWYAGDMHVHRSCGGAPMTVATMFQMMAPQGLAVISLLADMGNGEVQNPVTDLPKVNGQDASISTPGQILHWDAEWHWDPTYTQYPHQALGGHIVTLGLSQAQQVWQEYTYPIFQWAHQNNGIAGFAHLEFLDNTIPQTLTCCTPLEYPVEVGLGTSDFISEDVDQSGGTYPALSADAPIQAYYRLLNCGFRPGIAAGTDYPCNDGSSPGALLTYVQVAGGQLTYNNWIQGIKTGRTVISRNGHREFLALTVNGTATPGDEIRLTGGGSVPVAIQWTSSVNLSGTIELVQNGVVIATKQASATSGSPAELDTTATFAKSGWLAARRMGPDGHQVHTAAVFVIVDGAPIRASADDAQFYVQWMDNLLQNTSQGGPWNSFFPTNLTEAQARYSAARAVYQQIESEALALLSITTTMLPDAASNVPYSAQLAASGGTSPYLWTISSGSLPSGLSLNNADGVISGTALMPGSFAFTVQVSDSGNPKKVNSLPLNMSVSSKASLTIWPSTAVPGTVDSGPDSAVELGVRFSSDMNGYITGIRFYKANSNTGVHIANLWADTGALLATATFTSETVSGWQQVNFSQPVAITANSVYVASYHASGGHYSDDESFFSVTGVDSPPLHALADGVAGLNGVYSYGSTSNFPSQGWNGSNYWVDVVFQP